MQQKRPLAVPLASFTTSFSSSSSATSSSASPALSSSSKPPQSFQRISPEELSKLNQTSAALYRLLLKECLRLGASADSTADIGKSPRFLLQEDVDTDEFGKIQPFMKDYNAARRSTVTQQDKDVQDNDGEDENKADADADDRAVWAIISFFLQNLQRTNGKIQGKSEMLSKLDDSLVYADHSFGDSSDAYSRSPRHYHPISATPAHLVHAVRTAFFRIHDDGAGAEPKSLAMREMTKADIVALHRRAIDSVSMLHAQKRLMDCTSVGHNIERGVKVTATSKWKSKGLLSRGAGLERNEEHVFVYRIRIEYIGVNGSGKGKPIQLLGRRWRITDGIERKYQEHTGMDDYDHNDDDDHEEPDVQVVDAPRTGVVGYHPILHPGDVFEYTSGCNLIDSIGKMEGSYVFCEIEEEDIEEEAQKLGRIGDDLPAFKYEEEVDDEVDREMERAENKKRFFEVPVEPFLLDASK